MPCIKGGVSFSMRGEEGGVRGMRHKPSKIYLKQRNENNYGMWNKNFVAKIMGNILSHFFFELWRVIKLIPFQATLTLTSNQFDWAIPATQLVNFPFLLVCFSNRSVNIVISNLGYDSIKSPQDIKESPSSRQRPDGHKSHALLRSASRIFISIGMIFSCVLCERSFSFGDNSITVEPEPLLVSFHILSVI